MSEQDRIPTSEPRDRRPADAPPPEPAETAEQPAPAIEHKPEPDAENIIPVKHEPGTL